MPVDKNPSGGAGDAAGDETPDWTTWLRSRLERVVPDREATVGARNATPAPGTDPGADRSASGADHDAGTDEARGAKVEATTGAVVERVDALATVTAACKDLIEQQAASIERLTAWVQELATVQADDERWAVAIGRVVDAADEERRAAEDLAGAALVARVERIEDGLGRLTAELAGLCHALQRPAATVKLGEPQLHAVATGIAAALGARPTGSPLSSDDQESPSAGASQADDATVAKPRRTTPLRTVATGPARRAARRP